MQQFRQQANAKGIARQVEPEQPTTRMCPACKGAGTQLLISACPECEGSGSVMSATEPRYTYSLHETFRDGDQVWAIHYGTSLDSYVLTALRTVTDGPHAGALATTAHRCTRSGTMCSSPKAGSFIGEHHGERAVAGYIAAMNRPLVATSIESVAGYESP